MIVGVCCGRALAEVDGGLQRGKEGWVGAQAALNHHGAEQAGRRCKSSANITRVMVFRSTRQHAPGDV